MIEIITDAVEPKQGSFPSGEWDYGLHPFRNCAISEACGFQTNTGIPDDAMCWRAWDWCGNLIGTSDKDFLLPNFWIGDIIQIEQQKIKCISTICKCIEEEEKWIWKWVYQFDFC